MKKKYRYLLFSLFLCVFSIVGVRAEENAKCVYTLNSQLSANVVVTITDGNLDVKVTGSGYTFNSNASNLAQINFQSGGKWKCPSNLYYKITSGSRSAVISELTANSKDGYSSVPLNSSSSSDGGTVAGAGSSNSGETLSCQYGELVITYNAATFNYNKPCANTSVTFNQNDISLDYCPFEVYKVSSNGRGGDFCTYYLTSQGGSSTRIQINEDEPVVDADGNEQPDSKDTNTVTNTFAPSKVSGCGILGDTNSKTVQMLSWAFKLIRLGIPILIILLGMVDLFKIVFSGEDKVFKEAFMRFAKRIGIGMAFIFVPYILYFFIRISGVDVQYDIDNFYCGIMESTSGAKGTDSSNNATGSLKSCSEYSKDDCPATAENGDSCKLYYDNWDTTKSYGYCGVSSSSSNSNKVCTYSGQLNGTSHNVVVDTGSRTYKFDGVTQPSDYLDYWTTFLVNGECRSSLYIKPDGKGEYLAYYSSGSGRTEFKSTKVCTYTGQINGTSHKIEVGTAYKFDGVTQSSDYLEDWRTFLVNGECRNNLYVKSDGKGEYLAYYSSGTGRIKFTISD